jgi:hypothetical protein
MGMINPLITGRVPPYGNVQNLKNMSCPYTIAMGLEKLFRIASYHQSQENQKQKWDTHDYRIL